MAKRLVLSWLVLLCAPAAWSEATAQEPARIYLSQGEWQGAVLTESGHRIVADAAKSSASLPVTLLDINALADFASTPASQRRISARRAETVREELQRDGVPSGDIGVQIVDQPDGSVPPLRDEEKRRVVIVVHY
ncbi:MAG: hypothetical protein ACLPPF_03750 [Rhodomicrobium sp.]